MVEGARNNTLLKYGLLLLDNGMLPNEILVNINNFNDKLANKLDKDEIELTIMTTINNRYKEKINA